MTLEDWAALRQKAIDGMAGEAVRRPSANCDLLGIFRSYSRQGRTRVVDRFVAEAEATFSRLAGISKIRMPDDPDERLSPELRFFKPAGAAAARWR